MKSWLAHRPSAEKNLQEMENSVAVRKKDLEGLLLERIRDPGHAEIYTKMIADCEGDIADLQTKIEDFKNLDETVRQRKKEMKKSMDLLDAIVADGAVSDANLRMLVDKIVIFDVGGRLKVQIFLNGDFRRKIDCFDESGKHYVINTSRFCFHEILIKCYNISAYAAASPFVNPIIR